MTAPIMAPATAPLAEKGTARFGGIGVMMAVVNVLVVAERVVPGWVNPGITVLCAGQ